MRKGKSSENAPDIQPFDEFSKLTKEEQIKLLLLWKETYTIKDIARSWGIKHHGHYYYQLKKLGIYRDTVKFLAPIPSKESRVTFIPVGNTDIVEITAEHLKIQFNHVTTGEEAAIKLQRIVDLLKYDTNLYQVSVNIQNSTATK